METKINYSEWQDLQIKQSGEIWSTNAEMENAFSMLLLHTFQDNQNYYSFVQVVQLRGNCRVAWSPYSDTHPF